MAHLVDQVTGDKQSYKISDKIKKYTLKDVGFTETNNGNFVFDRPIGDSPYDANFRLKISISKDFDKLRMSVTDMSGLTNIDISKLKDSEQMVELYQYILDDFVNREILEKN
ncbi:cysteine desulfurase [Lactobacillus sp. YT155]|uniref:cysteine desulfurase n=1 Tax=Lactobacillus sp. YT155 TaxID=3060955 RepID=UPI00265EABF1|nr:cysteine desulfurase [Lactobacillus sp. YT155]MDO1605282.1 cysteine desulfurase [Lactobacillus sp. YT155]